MLATLHHVLVAGDVFCTMNSGGLKASSSTSDRRPGVYVNQNNPTREYMLLLWVSVFEAQARGILKPSRNKKGLTKTLSYILPECSATRLVLFFVVMTDSGLWCPFAVLSCAPATTSRIFFCRAALHLL